MSPTASQAYLALDVLASAQLPESDSVMKQARSTISAALSTQGWTGKTPECGEYGRQPLLDDKEQEKPELIIDGMIKR